MRIVLNVTGTVMRDFNENMEIHEAVWSARPGVRELCERYVDYIAAVISTPTQRRAARYVVALLMFKSS